MRPSAFYKGYHWPHILFFGFTPLLAAGGIVWVFLAGGPHGATWVLTLLMFLACGISTTGGYHRCFSHQSYSATLPVRLFYLLFGAGSFEGSARWWVCQHRYHHLYTDTEKDPYGINKGFWHAHIGWLFNKDQNPPSFDNVKDLDQDLLFRLQHRFFPVLAVGVGFLLPTAVASLWGDPWGGFFFAGLGRMVINHHATFCINSVCHTIGNQPYSDDEHSGRDSWIAAFLTYGEGYHNFHHTFPQDFRNGIRAFHWDPTKWFIQILGLTGLAGKFCLAQKEKILAAKLMMEQKQFVRSLRHQPEAIRQKAEEMIRSARIRLQGASVRFAEIQKNLQEARRARVASWNNSLAAMREDYRRAKYEFNIAMAEWRALIRGPISISL